MAGHGIQALTMARIAEAVGLTPGALYRHFRSRAEIVAAIVDRDLAELAEVDAHDLPRYLAAEADRYLADPAYPRVRRELLHLASTDAGFAARVRAYERDLVARVGARHETAVRAAQLLLDGLSLRADREGRIDPTTRDALRRVFHQLAATADAAPPDPPPTDARGGVTEETP